MDGLDLLSVGKAQQPLAGSVDRGERAGYGRPFQHIARGELLAERLRQRGHCREVGGTAMIDPVPKLPSAERFGAKLRHLGGKRRAAKPDEVASRRFGQSLLGRHGSPIYGCRAAQRLTSQARSMSASAWAKPASG